MKEIRRNKAKYIYLSIILAGKLIEHRIIATEEIIQFFIANALPIYFLE